MDFLAEAGERSIVSGQVVARRAVFGAMPARREKQVIGPSLGRQFDTTSSPTQH
jgi:hypothetical protein